MPENGSIKEKLIFYDQLRSMFDDLNIGVFTVDSQRKITSFNRAVQVLTGYQEGDVLGKSCYQVFKTNLCQGECKFHEAVEAEVTDFYSGKMDEMQIDEFLNLHHVSFIFWGPMERVSDGIDLASSSRFELRYEIGEYQLYEVQ